MEAEAELDRKAFCDEILRVVNTEGVPSNNISMVGDKNGNSKILLESPNH